MIREIFWSLRLLFQNLLNNQRSSEKLWFRIFPSYPFHRRDRGTKGYNRVLTSIADVFKHTRSSVWNRGRLKCDFAPKILRNPQKCLPETIFLVDTLKRSSWLYFIKKCKKFKKLKRSREKLYKNKKINCVGTVYSNDSALTSTLPVRYN